VQGPHLIDVDLHHVGEELIEVGIDIRIDAAPAARVMQVRGRRQRRLHQALCLSNRKPDFICDDGSRAPYPGHRHRRRTDAHHVAGVILLQVDVADRVGARESGNLGDEAEPPGLAPKLPVGDHLQPEAFLPADHVGDAAVLRRPPAGGKKLGRPEEAADVLGAERRSAHRGILRRD
jgi:hypothetical protein